MKAASPKITHHSKKRTCKSAKSAIFFRQSNWIWFNISIDNNIIYFERPNLPDPSQNYLQSLNETLWVLVNSIRKYFGPKESLNKTVESCYQV